MGLDLSFDDGQRAIADSVAQFCAGHCDDQRVRATTGELPRALWHELADVGVLAMADPDEEGGALEVCAAMESLGRAVFPGPLAASLLAMQVLPKQERAAVARGSLIVSAGCPPLMPFATCADLYLELTPDAVYRAGALGDVEPVATLGGEPWGRVRLERLEQLDRAESGLALYELALAAYLAAAGSRLIADAAEHARTRRQFGRPIGDFQAVAHPLADCTMRLRASEGLAREAAWCFDGGTGASIRSCSAAARLSAAAAALESAHVAHQVFGAIGVTRDGPVYHVSRRIRQVASAPPGDDAARCILLEDIGLGDRSALSPRE